MTNQTVKIAEINPDELTVRFMEIGLGLVRPKGKSAATLMSEVRAQVAGDPMKAKITDDFEKMAQAAIRYLAETINDAKSAH